MVFHEQGYDYLPTSNMAENVYFGYNLCYRPNLKGFNGNVEGWIENEYILLLVELAWGVYVANGATPSSLVLR